MSRPALGAYFAAVLRNNKFYNAQPQYAAAGLPGQGVVNLVKAVENLFSRTSRKTDAVVPDFKTYDFYKENGLSALIPAASNAVPSREATR